MHELAKTNRSHMVASPASPIVELGPTHSRANIAVTTVRSFIFVGTWFLNQLVHTTMCFFLQLEHDTYVLLTLSTQIKVG